MSRKVDNNLQGTIPTEIALLSDLQTLELVYADLTGTIPDLTALTNLQHLTLSGIGLTGTLPTSLSLLHEFLQVINVEHNHLTGALPDEVGALTNLRELRLAHNTLEGTIPETFIDLDQLCKSDVRHKHEVFEGNST
jgi:Leucine-rich repeat (LRR) protein